MLSAPLCFMGMHTCGMFFSFILSVQGNTASLLASSKGSNFLPAYFAPLSEHRHENSIKSSKKRKQPEVNSRKLLEADTSSDGKDNKEDNTKLVDAGTAVINT